VFLLDTNVISELRQPRVRLPDQRVTAWIARIPVASLFISVITVMELELGTLQKERRDPQQGAALRSWLSTSVIPNFTGRILPIDREIAQRAASLHVPTRIADLDALIAATALVKGLTVVTRNISHFAPTGAPTLNPWES
jgi:predicted nucleic acid-binding protein